MTLFPGGRALSRGGVLARGGRAGLAWSIDAASVVLLPVKVATSRRKRSDVLIDELSELVAMGLGGGDRLVRAGSPFRVVERDEFVLVGRAPASLLARIERALLREAQVRATEDDDLPAPEPERCVRL